MRAPRFASALLWFAAACELGPDAAPTVSATRRIVGGSTAPEDAAVVRLELGAWTCSGALIGPRTVLTAAHCALPPGMESSVSVEVDPGDGAGLLSRGVVAQHLHPRWDVRTGAHDLLLLQLRDAVPGVKPLRLYPRPLTSGDVGRALRVLGYVVTEAGTANGKGTRREVTLSIRQVLPTKIEAGAEGKQACEGDSGGPGLLRLEPEGPDYLAATVSEGDRTCRATGFYARVDIDASWIVTTTSVWDSIEFAGTSEPSVADGSLDEAGEPPGAPPAAPGRASSAGGTCSQASVSALVPWAGLLLARLWGGARVRRRRPAGRRPRPYPGGESVR